MGWVDEIEECALGIDAGDDGFDGDFFAIGEDDGGDGAVFDADVLDFGIGANFGTGVLADSARAWVKEPSPPRGKDAEPTGCGSAAARSRRTAVEPADQGPRAEPKIPRAAMLARSNSVSKNSATKSATAIGPQRRRSKIPFLPRPRTSRPVLKRFQRSSGEGLSIDGRSDGSNLGEDFGDFGEGIGEFGVFGGVFGGEAGDAAGGFGVIVVEE